MFIEAFAFDSFSLVPSEVNSKKKKFHASHGKARNKHEKVCVMWKKKRDEKSRDEEKSLIFQHAAHFCGSRCRGNTFGGP